MVQTMRSTNGNGNYIFFQSNHDKVYYSLIDKYGDVLRKGEMSMSEQTFVDLMQKLGFEYLPTFGKESF